MADAKVDKVNTSNDQLAQKSPLQEKSEQEPLIKPVDKTVNSSDDINTKIEVSKKHKSDEKIVPATLTDPQLSKGNQNNYVAKAEKALRHEANIKKFKEKKYEEDVAKEVGQIIIDDEQDIEENIEDFMQEKITQAALAIKEELDEDKKEEESKQKEQMAREEIDREIKEEQEKDNEVELSILEEDHDDLLEKEKISKVEMDDNVEQENKEFYTTTPTPKPGVSKPSKDIEELLKQGGDNLSNLLQKTGDDAGNILKKNIAAYNAFHQAFLNEPNATKRDGLVKQMQDTIQSNPTTDNAINANMNHIVNDVIDIYADLRRGDVPTNQSGIVSHNTTTLFGGNNVGSQESGSVQQVEQNKSKLPTPLDINLTPPDGVNK